MLSKFNKTLISGLIGLNSLGLISPSIEANCISNTKLSEKAELVDIYLASFFLKASAETRISELKRKLDPKLRKFIKLSSNSGFYKIRLDLNTTHSSANQIISELKKNEITNDSYKKVEDYFYNPNSTDCRYANIIVGAGGLENLVRSYTTAYGNEVKKTVSRYKKDLNSGKTPKSGEIFKVPVRHLKEAFKMSLKEEKDYFIVDISSGKDRNNIWEIVENYTIGDIQTNIEILKKYNGIKDSQVDNLSKKTEILIPKNIYSDPLEAKIISEFMNSNNFEPDVLEYIESAEKYTVKVKKKIDSIIQKYKSEKNKKKENTENKRNKKGKNNNHNNTKTNSIQQSSTVKVKINKRPKGIGVLRDTKKPAVLIELFNIQNLAQINFYSNERNLKEISYKFCQGVVNYENKHRPSLEHIIIDNGHGKHDLGARDLNHGTDKREGHFTIKLQKYLSKCLKEENFNVHSLNYDKKANRKKRINYYINQANKIGNSKNSIYISTHVDSIANTKSALLPRIFVHNKGNQKYSMLLAQEMLKVVVPHYKKNFKK